MSNQSINYSYSLHQVQDAEASTDSLSIMMEQERITYSCLDYLNRKGDGQDGKGSNKITPNDRMKIVDWCYALVDKCQFERENVAIAMNIVDRFMSTSISSASSLIRDILHDRSQYQLVAVTALYISIKINEPYAFGSKELAAACHGTYSVEDIEDMELEILQGLSWRLCPPTGLCVAHQILSLMLHHVTEDATIKRETSAFIQEEVAFQTENAVREYFFTTQRPSTIAAAAILNAIEQVNDHDYEHLMSALIRVLEEFDFDSPIELLEARDQLNRFVYDNTESDIVEIIPNTSSDTHYQEDESIFENKPFVNKT